jgi:hypothetical protein
MTPGHFSAWKQLAKFESAGNTLATSNNPALGPARSPTQTIHAKHSNPGLNRKIEKGF